MRTHVHSKALIYLLLGALLFATLACSLAGSGGEEEDADQRALELAATQLAVELTQQALEDHEQTQPTEPVASTTPPDVSYEGISFSYDEALASGVDSETVPGEEDGASLWTAYPTYFHFSLEGYPLPDSFHRPEISVYPLPEYIALAADVETITDDLKQILASQSAGGEYIPCLPFYGGAPFFQAQVEYLDFEGGSGVRFLSMYGQSAYVLSNQDLFYAFQGITDDGRYFISGVLPVANPILPDNAGEDTPEDWESFIDNFGAYRAETGSQLDDQSPSSFTPTLAQLDAIFESLQIDR
jgi:hypothetical protein